jgi:hypothetical protein
VRQWLEKRRKAIAAGILCLGLVAALGLYATATPPGDDAEESLHSKQYLRQMELYGGKANVLANEAREWLDSLWHGRRLAFTVAFLSIVSAELTLVVLTPLDDDDTAGTPPAPPRR